MTQHLPFDGILNFRDFGGYATTDGRRMKRGYLFRSANHAQASADDLRKMRDMGVAHIVDLRERDERRRDPSLRWDGCQAEIVENDLSSRFSDWSMLLKESDLTPAFFRNHAQDFYRALPTEPRYIDLYTRYFRALASGSGPMLVHCTAGKDRTGVICALTHHIAGVHPDDILSDYLLTNSEKHIASRMAAVKPMLEERAGRPIPEESLRVMLSVEPSFMEATMGVVLDRYGSTDAYLEEVLGVDAAKRETIRELILD